MLAILSDYFLFFSFLPSVVLPSMGFFALFGIILHSRPDS
jgi:hypothetical protein